jgi:hypothetical protein
MTGLSAAYCHEISLSNPKRFVTVNHKSRKSVPRCSTRKTKKTCSDFNWKKKKDIKSFIKKIPNTCTYKRLLNSERFHIYPSPTNFNDFLNGVWDIPAQNKSQRRNRNAQEIRQPSGPSFVSYAKLEKGSVRTFFFLQTADKNLKTEESINNQSRRLQYAQCHLKLWRSRERSIHHNRFKEAYREMVIVGDCAGHQSQRV